MIVERKFRNDKSMQNYMQNKWMIKQLKKKYSPEEYTAKVHLESRELRIFKR